jgi:hypothetical protein
VFVADISVRKDNARKQQDLNTERVFVDGAKISLEYQAANPGSRLFERLRELRAIADQKGQVYLTIGSNWSTPPRVVGERLSDLWLPASFKVKSIDGAIWIAIAHGCIRHVIAARNSKFTDI